MGFDHYHIDEAVEVDQESWDRMAKVLGEHHKVLDQLSGVPSQVSSAKVSFAEWRHDNEHLSQEELARIFHRPERGFRRLMYGEFLGEQGSQKEREELEVSIRAYEIERAKAMSIRSLDWIKEEKL
jgi:hypothetical protein